MRAGRCRYTKPILIKTERGLRDAASAAARAKGLSLSEMVRRQLREIVAMDAAKARRGGSMEARP